MQNDSETDAGQVFFGNGISLGNPGMVQLWNPTASGVSVYVDRVIAAASVTSGMFGADIRKISTPMGREMLDDSGNRLVSNAIVSSTVMPKAHTRIDNGTIPTHPPLHEIWIGQNQSEREYVFDPPLRVDPGWGIYVTAAFNGNMIATFHWREKPIT